LTDASPNTTDDGAVSRFKATLSAAGSNSLVVTSAITKARFQTSEISFGEGTAFVPCVDVLRIAAAVVLIPKPDDPALQCSHAVFDYSKLSGCYSKRTSAPGAMFAVLCERRSSARRASPSRARFRRLVVGKLRVEIPRATSITYKRLTDANGTLATNAIAWSSKRSSTTVYALIDG